MSVLPPTPGLQTTFDDNNDELLQLLTKGWENPLNISESKWTRDYLTKLTALSLDELLHEPAELREEQVKAKRDAQQLAFRDYPSFLHAQTCRREAEETLDGLHVHLGEFISSVPELQQACEEFTLKATELKEKRGKITSVLEHQNVLTDLLEIPQLMETCVWNGYYSEAMDLASHVRLLQVRYPLPVVKSIQQQVQASSDLMLIQLISHLQKPIRLAASMNVVGFLRRMDVFASELQLRLVFLRCRNEFLQQRLSRVKRDLSEDPRQRSTDAFEYLKRFIDVIREQVFEIGTQYMSIFSNDQGSSLLSDYMVNITLLIKNTLKTYLSMIEDTSALASLLSQLQYCGLSLGRIGLDFRHIFVQSFEEAVQPMILKWIDSATEDLVKIIVKSTEEAAAPSTWMSSKIVSQTAVGANEEEKRHAFQPPLLLVGYPSLAIFTNGILSAFNALRLLPALSLFLPIQNHLEACFLEIGNALKQYSDQAVSHIPDEVVYVQSFSAAFVRCCVPYLKFCLVDGIYSELSAPGAVDEDLELLLVDYLPVVEKEYKEEEVEEDKENEVTKEEEKEADVDEHVTLNNTAIQEDLSPADTTRDNENDVTVEVSNNSSNVSDSVVVENRAVKEIQEETINEEKDEEKTDELIKPNEDTKHGDTDSPSESGVNETQKDNVTVEEKEEAGDNHDATEEKTDAVHETEKNAENPVEPAEKSPVTEEPLVEENSVIAEDTPASVDSMPTEAKLEEAKEESEPIHAEVTPTVENSTSDAPTQEELPSTAEHSDEEQSKEDDGVVKEEAEAKSTPDNKKPQPQQPKKSKKHKGKKGRR